MPSGPRHGLAAALLLATSAGFGWSVAGAAGAAIAAVAAAGASWLLLRPPAEPLPSPPPEPAPPPAQVDVVETDRLESLGVLAGGIAHDFNNLLTGILGNANLALTDLGPGPAREAVEEIELAARRAHELVAQLLAYAGQGRLEVQPVHVPELVREMAELLKRVIDPRARLTLHLTDEPAIVEADSRQLRQIVMNLITNASDALGTAPGDIEVIVALEALDRGALDAVDLGAGLRPGDYVRLEVRDTGSGMDAETRQRIFEPFFTTKFTGRGLGLAALRGIVRQHAGCLDVQSQPGRGTSFRVWLPWADVDESEDVPTDHGTRIRRWKIRAGTVLLAEDEEIVRRAATRMLSKLGFDVIAVNDGADAVRAFLEDPDEFRAVLLDVQMPELDGIEALARIRAAGSGVPVILCTGFEREAIVTSARPDAWLQKPFGIKDLVTAMDQALLNHPGSTIDDEGDD